MSCENCGRPLAEGRICHRCKESLFEEALREIEASVENITRALTSKDLPREVACSSADANFAHIRSRFPILRGLRR